MLVTTSYYYSTWYNIPCQHIITYLLCTLISYLSPFSPTYIPLPYLVLLLSDNPFNEDQDASAEVSREEPVCNERVEESTE